MKLKWSFLLGVLLSLLTSRHPARAQTSTVLMFVQWDPNPVTENVVRYTLRVDTTAPLIIQPPVLNVSCSCIQQAINVAPGGHVLTLTASNYATPGDPRTLREGDSATVSFTADLPIVPTAAKAFVRNIRVVKP